MHWYGDAEQAIKHGMDAMSVEFLVENKIHWGESIRGEIYIPQHNVEKGKNTLAT